jgi:hypothetical protein
MDEYNIPTDSTILILIPPTKCAACKLPAFEAIKELRNVYILSADSSIFSSNNSGQVCIFYNKEFIERKGLVNIYPEKFIIINNRVTEYYPIISN